VPNSSSQPVLGWSIAAAAAAAWAIVAIVFASLAPSGLVPHIFYSYHVEHFAAFYVATLLVLTGLARAPISRLFSGLAVLAFGLEAFRMLLPAHRLTSAEDLLSDIGGILAAMAPVFVAHVRDSVGLDQRRSPPAA
jgi:hypothetical protein